MASAGIGLLGAILVAVLADALSPIVALLAVLGAIAACAMIASPAVAISILCLSLPFERIGRFTDDFDPVAISVNRVLGIITLCSLLLHAALRKKKLRFGGAFFLYAGYAALAFLGNVWAYSPEETFRQSFAILGNLLFFFLIINMVRTYADARKAILLWLLASFLAGVLSLGDYFIGFTGRVKDAEMGLTSKRLTSTVDDGAEVRSLGTNVRRLFGPTGHPTLFGLNMTMAMPFFLWVIQWTRGKPATKLFWFGGLLVSVFCMFLSNTRAVMILFGATAIFCLWRRLFKPNLRTLVGACLVAVVVIPFIPRDVYMRALDPSLYTTKRGDSLRVRFKFWAKSWDLIQESWTHGIGVGNETELLERITDEATGYLSPSGLRASAHNEYIWVMVEVGILGYLLFWSFIAKVTAASFKAAAAFRRLPDASEERFMMIACQAIMLGVLLFATQSEAFHYPLKAWWLVAGISCNLLAEARQRNAELAADNRATAAVA